MTNNPYAIRACIVTYMQAVGKLSSWPPLVRHVSKVMNCTTGSVKSVCWHMIESGELKLDTEWNLRLN